MVTTCSPRPMRAVQRARLWAITWIASQAALAAKRQGCGTGVPWASWRIPAWADSHNDRWANEITKHGGKGEWQTSVQSLPNDSAGKRNDQLNSPPVRFRKSVMPRGRFRTGKNPSLDSLLGWRTRPCNQRLSTASVPRSEDPSFGPPEEWPAKAFPVGYWREPSRYEYRPEHAGHETNCSEFGFGTIRGSQLEYRGQCPWPAERQQSNLLPFDLISVRLY